MKECKHEWLTPANNRTTCKLCGRDGFITLDREPQWDKHLTEKFTECPLCRRNDGHHFDSCPSVFNRGDAE
jgi:hypothetical protein